MDEQGVGACVDTDSDVRWAEVKLQLVASPETNFFGRQWRCQCCRGSNVIPLPAPTGAPSARNIDTAVESST